MTTIDETTRLLTGEVEDCVALLGNRLVGGGMRVESIRVALGQTGEVAEDESFLLAPHETGLPGWAVEVRVLASDDVPAHATTDATGASPAPLRALEGRPCTVLRGTDAGTAALLAHIGIETVDQLALLEESRLGELRASGAGLRLLDSWSRAQLLRLPLPAVPLGDLATQPLDAVAGAPPERLRALGLPAEVPDAAAEELARTLAFLGGSLDVAVLRALTVAQVSAGAPGPPESPGT